MRISHLLKRNEDGVALIEFALIFPVLLLMFYGIVEVSRYVQANQKAQDAVATAANFFSQVTPNTAGEVRLSLCSVRVIMRAVPNVMVPYEDNYVIYVTAMKGDVRNARDEPTANILWSAYDWSMVYGALGAGLGREWQTAKSKITGLAYAGYTPRAPERTRANMPDYFKLGRNDVSMAVEIYVRFRLLFINDFARRIFGENDVVPTIYRMSFARPRHGVVDQLSPNDCQERFPGSGYANPGSGETNGTVDTTF